MPSRSPRRASSGPTATVVSRVLGRIVEVLRGKPFDTVLTERLAVPLGLTVATTYAEGAALHAAWARGRAAGDRSGPESDWPAGSALAVSARDLLAFAPCTWRHRRSRPSRTEGVAAGLRRPPRRGATAGHCTTTPVAWSWATTAATRAERVPARRAGTLAAVALSPVVAGRRRCSTPSSRTSSTPQLAGVCEGRVCRSREPTPSRWTWSAWRVLTAARAMKWLSRKQITDACGFGSTARSASSWRCGIDALIAVEKLHTVLVLMNDLLHFGGRGRPDLRTPGGEA